ncbi:MAG: response regulator [Sandaracinus sp.]|nr:response regulator [Sandaracinus sp.]MCB9620272.1 response regulator [Sandaracinus sp.]
MRALVVDDSAAMRRLLAEIVRERGYEVVALESGEEALAAHDAEPFDLFLVDWTLPGLSGVELCRALRSRPDGDRPTIVVITGRSRPEDVHAVLDAGADDFVPKPIDADRLRTRLVVASRRARGHTHATPPELGVLAAAVDAVLLVRGDRVVDANVAAALGLGHDSVPSLVGAALSGLVHADDRAALATPGGPRRVRLRRRDGSFTSFEATTALDPSSGAALVVGRVASQGARDVRELIETRIAGTSLLLEGLAQAWSDPLQRVLGTKLPDEAREDLRHVAELVGTVHAIADDDRGAPRTPSLAVVTSCLQIARVSLRRRARVEIDVRALPELAISSARLAQVVLGIAEALLPHVEEVAPATLTARGLTDPRGWLALNVTLRGERRPTRARDLVDPTTSAAGLVVARTLTVHAGGTLDVELTEDDALVVDVRIPPRL